MSGQSGQKGGQGVEQPQQLRNTPTQFDGMEPAMDDVTRQPLAGNAPGAINNHSTRNNWNTAGKFAGALLAPNVMAGLEQAKRIKQLQAMQQARGPQGLPGQQPPTPALDFSRGGGGSGEVVKMFVKMMAGGG